MLQRFAISLLVAVLALPAAARTRPHYGGTLRVEMEGDPWQRPGGLARRLVLDGLTLVDANGVPSPALATTWNSENSDHRWQFRLRSGVQFQDGSALTPSAVVASLAASCAANCPWGAIHAVGASVVFTSDSPMPNLPAILAGDAYLIQSGAAGVPGGIVGTGPFQPTGLANGVLTLAANENGWQGRPFVDGIEIQSHRSIRDQWLDLSLGRADLVEVPAEQLRQAHDQRLTVTASPAVSLLAIAVSDAGPLASPPLRSSLALAIDRGALSNVIFQKQGEITASLLPATLTGYSFLFPAERDLNKSHELRGGLTAPTLTLAAEGGNAMQLAAQRIALNLHEAGFNVQVVAANSMQHIDLRLRRFPLESSTPQASLEAMLRTLGAAAQVTEITPAGLFRMEREFLGNHTVIPLLYLPRAYAAGGRVRELRLSLDGSPQLAGASLEDGQ